MTTWTAGYVADIGYTHGFYRELTPALLNFVMLTRGQRGPDLDGRAAYCELGCGQGVSTNLLAAANPNVDFHATDFNPAQIAGARALAAEAGTPNVHFYDHSFSELLHEPALPAAFDVIALHGIYSWISPENRAHIVEFLRRRLKPGGIVYISYNTLPGWAAAMPLRRLLTDHAGTRTGPIIPRIDEAVAFAESMREAKASYFTQNPALAPRFEKMKGLPRSYLAHEYFNRDWTPFYVADVAAELAEAKLSYVGSAALLEGVDAINLTAEQQAILKACPDPVRRETLRDYMVNQQFRRDVYVKGALPHTVPSSRAIWTHLRFALSTPRADVALKVQGSLGEAQLQEEVYRPILDVLAKGPATVQAIFADPSVKALDWGKLMEAFGILVGSGHVQPCPSPKDEAARAKRTKAFNAAVTKRAEATEELQFLASPVTGSGVPADRMAQLFLAAQGSGADPVQRAWAVLQAQGQRLVKDGKPLDGDEANLADLRERYDTFVKTRLPVFRQLGIA
ncbi:methyltransferase regulatory domain-containing protein [Methylobacterium sp. Leaf100]|uniref:methyltransferase regulatory domain-containing protein n=1 Tax=Methylobacterium sp. Leaf100 TaxID=1736252 RepID=UPI0006F30B14|nr:methyltransferase regulatory domain-containing protein [Methylobacterium sp. Leaf100]KQP34945.1 methyltransferase type 11 [Methylobacterium sp. Leaf100]